MTSEPRRILHIDIEGGFGGSSRSLAMYVLGLQKLKQGTWTSQVLCKSSGPVQQLYDNMNVSCEVFSHMFTRIPLAKYNFRNLLTAIPKFRDIWRLHRKILSMKPDTIHLNYAGLMFNGLLLKLSGFSGTVVIHSRVIWPKNAFARLFTWLLYRSSDHVIAIAEPVRQAHIANGLPEEKISVIHNPSVSSSIPEINNERAQQICRISYLGTVGNLKGPERLIELADLLEQRKFPFEIRIYGGAPRRKSLTKKLDKELESIVKRQSRSQDKYIFSYEGHVADPESRISKSDFIVRPSKSNDPWGRDVIETMSHGKVIVATGFFDGFIKHQVNGFLIGEWDAEKVADVISDTWANQNYYQELCQSAFDFAQIEFAPTTAASKFLDILTKTEEAGT